VVKFYQWFGKRGKIHSALFVSHSRFIAPKFLFLVFFEEFTYTAYTLLRNRFFIKGVGGVGKGVGRV